MNEVVPDVQWLVLDTLASRSVVGNKCTVDVKSNSKMSDSGVNTQVGHAQWAATSSIIKRATSLTKQERKTIAMARPANDWGSNAFNVAQLAHAQPSRTYKHLRVLEQLHHDAGANNHAQRGHLQPYPHNLDETRRFRPQPLLLAMLAAQLHHRKQTETQ